MILGEEFDSAVDLEVLWKMRTRRSMMGGDFGTYASCPAQLSIVA